MQYKLIMGNQAYSSWSLRGWLLLRAFDIEFGHEVVPLYVPGWELFLNAHYPANTVPALVEGDPFYPTGLRKSINLLQWTRVFADGSRLI